VQLRQRRHRHAHVRRKPRSIERRRRSPCDVVRRACRSGHCRSTQMTTMVTTRSRPILRCACAPRTSRARRHSRTSLVPYTTHRAAPTNRAPLPQGSEHDSALYRWPTLVSFQTVSIACRGFDRTWPASPNTPADGLHNTHPARRRAERKPRAEMLHSLFHPTDTAKVPVYR